ncbi:MAG TPA: M20/M25/M40 family metallo-hydrolase [Pyrinomonadaceae bacterium]|nr:M20/M25/M40 family metallo-hydrolase [Pyrinomonadaceae bacterium]
MLDQDVSHPIQTNVRLKEEARQRTYVSVASAAAWVAFILCILLAALSIYKQQPPNSVPASATPTDFSSGRAMRDVEAISRNARPIGSLEHAVVREYILSEVASMGVASAELQETTVVSDHWGVPYRVAKVRNILAKLKGTGQGKAVLLASHYDSVSTGPGASDNAVAVAALLETLRALKAGGPLKNDVIFLFTDGEEAGLLGAKAFVEEHPWAKDVGIALNFDARGTTGPSYMFQTSDRNGWLIQEFAKAAPHPISNSFANEIYRLLPNDTDMTVFNRAGFDGLNFAYIDGSTKYHTMQDSYANVDERSLQHQGSYALALTRRFGNLDLPAPRQANAVYFNLFGSLFFYYSSSWVLPLAGIVLVLFIAVIFYGYKKRRLTISGLALGVLAFVLSVSAAYGVVRLTWWLIYRFGGAQQWLLSGNNAYDANWYLLSFVALSMAVTAVIYLLFSRRVDAVNLTLGALVWWVVLMIVTAVYLPGGSYLLMWPLLFGLLGVAVALAFPQLGRVKMLAVATLCALPGLFLLAPLIHSLGVALALNSPERMQVPVALLLGLLIPQLYAVLKSSGWVMPSVMAALGIALIIYAHQTFKFDQDHPRQNNVFYALNADTGKATWASTDQQVDKWTAGFFTNGSERGSIEEYLPNKYNGFLKSAAPTIAARGPEVTLLEDKTTDDVRVTRLRITSLRQAPIISIYADVTTPDLKATIDGKTIGDVAKPAPVDANHRWGLIYSAVPPGGIELVLRMKSPQPLKLSVVERSFGLPQIPQMSTTYPVDVIPAPTALSDSTFVTRNFIF